MANNYCDSSTFLEIPLDKLEEARKMAGELVESIKENEGWCGAGFDIEDEEYNDGVWFSTYENFSPNHAVIIAQALIDTFEIDEPLIIHWASTCSKLRPDEFTGGAVVVSRGREPQWIIPSMIAEKYVCDITNGEHGLPSFLK